MALEKNIIQKNGVTTVYHRVLKVASSINSHTSISVGSYIDLNSRNKEKTIEDTDDYPYIVVKTYETRYKENFTVQEAYTYLKSLPEFQGATDVFEEGQVV